MTAAELEQVLGSMIRSTPFRAFTVDLVTGERIQVDLPESLVYRGGTAVVFGPLEALTIFDYAGVTRITDAGDQSLIA